ncbi:unnamed protein product, partial [Medioppia subpectinata]
MGQPIFPGDSGVDQLVEIIKVLGTPTKEQIREMNRNYTEFKFPQIKAHPWQKVFRTRTPPEAIELVSRLLEYTPSSRITPLQACAHPFFNELREPGTRLPNNKDLPLLFNFTEHELKIQPSLESVLIPPHLRGVVAAGGASGGVGVGPVASASTSSAGGPQSSVAGMSCAMSAAVPGVVGCDPTGQQAVSAAVGSAGGAVGSSDMLQSNDAQTSTGAQAVAASSSQQ